MRDITFMPVEENLLVRTRVILSEEGEGGTAPDFDKPLPRSELDSAYILFAISRLACRSNVLELLPGPKRPPLKPPLSALPLIFLGNVDESAFGALLKERFP